LLTDEEASTGLGLGGLVSFADPKSDPYLTNPEIDDDESDIEDFQIKATDNLLLVGHVEGNAAILEVYGKESSINDRLTSSVPRLSQSRLKIFDPL